VLKSFRLLVLPLFFVCGAILAADGPPSDESLHRLMEMSQTQRLLDSVAGQVDAGMQAGMQQALKGETLDADQRAVIDDMRTKIVAMFKEQYNWSKMEPLFIDIYRKSFTQSEVDGMIAFYSSPAGQAVITKMPLVMQNSMQMVQQQMGPMLEKMAAIEKDAIARIKAKKDQPAAGNRSSKG
jgi:hypothetical protein